MSVQLSISVKRPSEAARALHWYAGGLRLWARAPLRLLILSNIPLLVELCLQQIPVAGVLISKLLAPIVTAGVLLGVQSLADGQRLRSDCILAALNPERLPKLLRLNVLLLSIFAFQVMVAVLGYGTAGLQAALFLKMASSVVTRGFELTMMLPGAIPGTFLMLAMPLVLFSREAPLAAAMHSMHSVVCTPIAFIVYAIISTAALASALTWGHFLPVLLLQPWSLTSMYCAYRDLIAESR